LKGGAQSRSEQMQLISGILHDQETSNELGELIKQAEQEEVTFIK
jgi:Zn-dependent M32 family carboxypeptidase